MRKGIKKFRSIRAKLNQSRKERVFQNIWSESNKNQLIENQNELKDLVLKCFSQQNEIDLTLSQFHFLAGIFNKNNIKISVDNRKVISPYLYNQNKVNQLI